VETGLGFVSWRLCESSTEAGTGGSRSFLVSAGVSSPTVGGRRVMSIVVTSTVSGTSVDDGVEATMLAQVWSNGAVVLLLASLRFGQIWYICSVSPHP
jgi:hypothetical protein